MGRTTLYLNPEFKTPTDTTSAEVADHDPRLRTWRWDASETMHAFWAAGRACHGEVRDIPGGSAVARINMELEEQELAVVAPGVGAGLVLAINLPVLVNTGPVKNGDELLMEAAPKWKQGQEHKDKPQKETWRTQEDRNAKKQKKGSDSSARMQL